jgi:penicillin amidase
LLPDLLRHAHPANAADQRAIEILKRWDGNAAADSAAAAIFGAWFHHLTAAIAGDELGPVALDAYAGRFSFITRFVKNVLASGSSPWCDDVTTSAAETCADTVTAALRAGVGDLERLLGGDMDRWRWDSVHVAIFPHQGFDAVPALRPLFSRSMPHGGDWSTVNVGPVFAPKPFEQHSLPGYREIVDLSPANDSRFLEAVGPSGNVFSPHFDDGLKAWSTGQYRRMRLDRSEIEQGAVGHLRLTPLP